jgi:hypothetical protein
MQYKIYYLFNAVQSCCGFEPFSHTVTKIFRLGDISHLQFNFQDVLGRHLFTVKLLRRSQS